jgi:type II secretory pathway component PulF
MAGDGAPTSTSSVQRERRERRVAWIATTVASLYCCWMGLQLWRATATFEAMFEGLGAELPLATRIVVEHGPWLYPAYIIGFVAILVWKELILADKRLSTMVTCLVLIVAQFVGHWFTVAYYLPLFDLIKKLG